MMKSFLRSAGLFVVLLSAMLIHFACQLPTEPTNVTTNSPTTIIVEDQGNNPVLDPTLSIEWRTLRATDSAWHSMPLANAPTHDGTFADVIPIPIGDDTTLVVFQVNAPLGYAPQTQLDTEIGYCGSRTFTFHLTQVPITVTVCDPTAKSATLSLVANEPSKPRDTAKTADFINSLGALTFSFTAKPILPTGPALPSIALVAFVNGNPQNWPVTVPASSGYQFRYFFTTDSLTSQSSSTQYVVTIIGKDATGDVCVNMVDTVKTQINVQTPCDCPTGTFRYYDTASTCIGSSAEDTVASKLSNSNTQCSIVLTRLASSKLDNDVVLSPDLNGMVIPPGSNIPAKIALTFTPQSVKTYDVEYDYGIALKSQSGTITPCDSVLRIYFHGTVGTPACAIDPTSPLLQNDTLMQVINSDSEGGKQLCVKNTGACPLSINSAVLSGADPHPFHLSSGLPVTVSSGSSGCVSVTFNPTEQDVWPNGRGAGMNPTDTFRATLSITTSTGCDTTIPIIGIIALPNYNNPCLEQWGQNKFFGGIILGDSGTYSNTLNTKTSDNFSIYVTGAVTATSATLTSGTNGGVTFLKILPNIPTLAPQTICDISSKYAGQCGTGGGATSIAVAQGDVILFEFTDPFTFKQECGVMWISEFSQTAGPGTPFSVCFQLCFPI
ncbi:MAG TPA: hypothetical protein VGM92_00145 [Candidatus Kapabacteria bacterium]|jgi:hypothetical protein